MLPERQLTQCAEVLEMSDSDLGLLLDRARDGDQSAFEQIYRLHVNRVYALCLRMSADRDLAESLTQDAFVRAWRNLSSFEGRSQFATWLHRLTVNVVLDQRRRTRRKDARETSLDENPVARQVSETRSRPEQGGDRMDLEKAIATLPEGARSAFVLHDVQGYKIREIAELSDLAVGTIKAQLHRARRLLREALA
jgi:RNA polymerase sigma-70 factor (ECF subfamily)